MLVADYRCPGFEGSGGAMNVQEMIRTHPQPHVKGRTNDALIRCIEECCACATTCTSCADACLGESAVADLVQCIRLNLDCAELCETTGRIATRRTGSDEQVLRSLLQTCATACRVCAEECAAHADRHEHCKICAAACERCEQACQDALGTLVVQ
jgi:hypothetical protein